ncbi:MAG TPA: T9SS type A sorting domain-containing protein, partial [Bacteroidia bacterium]|nr:T9SS type A sorting domain-containing protein [Bacteroidia bacterium]
HINVDSVTVGEVGTESKGSVTSTTPFLLDGSGGYYWATDTSSVFAFGPTVYSYVRSEKNGIFVLAYGWVPFYAPEAIGNSVMICVQSNTAGDPIAYDAATAWLDKIDGPDTSYTNAQVPVTGSAWIDWGPSGTGWLNFANYSMYYQLQGSSTWTRIVKDTLIEIHHNNLINWNTAGLSAGNYNLKLTVKDNFNDSVEAIKPITLLIGVTGIKQTITTNADVLVYPNPTNGNFIIETNSIEKQNMQIFDVNGKLVLSQVIDGKKNIDVTNLNEGVYNVSIISSNSVVNKRVVIVR